MQNYTAVIALIVIVGLAALYFIKSFIQRTFRRITVFEYERAIMFRDGKFEKILQPGSYWYIPLITMVCKHEIRPRFVIVQNQELLTADNMSVKISLALNYRVVDVYAAVNNTERYEDALYAVAQLALREIVASMKIDELLTSRQAVSERLQKEVESKVCEFGLELIAAQVRDIMVPGELKKVISQVVKAQKEAQAKIEKARGEAAALRTLANAARMIETHPHLMQLRLLQSIGESSGNTIVYGAPVNGAALQAATRGKGEEQE